MVSVPVLERQLLDGPGDEHAGVVDQDADLAERARHVLHDRGASPGPGRPRRRRARRPRCRRREGPAPATATLSARAGADADAIAGAAEGERGGSADAVGGAGDERGGRGGHGKKIISFRHDFAASAPRRPAQHRRRGETRGAPGLLAGAAPGAATPAPPAAHGVGDRAAVRRRAFSLLRIARALVPLAVLWVGKLIVDEVVVAVAVVGAGGPIPWVRLAELLALELGIALVGEGLEPALRAAGEPARRSLRQPDQRRAHAPLRDARPGAVRGRRDLRQAGAGPPADGRTASGSSPCSWRRSRI